MATSKARTVLQWSQIPGGRHSQPADLQLLLLLETTWAPLPADLSAIMQRCVNRTWNLNYVRSSGSAYNRGLRQLQGHSAIPFHSCTILSIIIYFFFFSETVLPVVFIVISCTKIFYKCFYLLSCHVLSVSIIFLLFTFQFSSPLLFGNTSTYHVSFLFLSAVSCQFLFHSGHILPVFSPLSGHI